MLGRVTAKPVGKNRPPPRFAGLANHSQNPADALADNQNADDHSADGEKRSLDRAEINGSRQRSVISTIHDFLPE